MAVITGEMDIGEFLSERCSESDVLEVVCEEGSFSGVVVWQKSYAGGRKPTEVIVEVDESESRVGLYANSINGEYDVFGVRMRGVESENLGVVEEIRVSEG